MKPGLFLILFPVFLFVSTDVHAMAVLMRIQQQKAMKQQQAQAQYQAEYGQQSPAAPQTPAQPTYQQMIDERNQAIAQAIINAHSNAVSTANLPAGAAAVDQTQQQNFQNSMAQYSQAPSSQAQEGETVDLAEVWKKLDKKATVWALLADDQAKLLTVSEYIGRFQKEGVKINEPPAHYVQMIDQISQSNPQMLQRPFGELIQILAIIDYDFDNGMDKDALAKAVLGEAGYEANKQRFTQATQQQGP